MGKRYGSFLLRCWRLTSGRYRIEIEHIQSGEKRRLSSLAAALEWIEAQVGDEREAMPAPATLKEAAPRDPRPGRGSTG